MKINHALYKNIFSKDIFNMNLFILMNAWYEKL